jgi:hypothetical protein
MKGTTAISLSLFKGLKDNKPTLLEFESWEKFVRLLSKLGKRKLDAKDDADAISPAVFTPGETRANRNVLHWGGWAAVDVDDTEGPLSLDFFKRFEEYDYYVYSTASSKKDHPKFRIVFHLNRRILADEIRRFWFSLQTLVDAAGDTQCKDLSRMYYIPADYKDAYNFSFQNKGKPLDVDQLMLEYPMLRKTTSVLDNLPEEVQNRYTSYKKNQLEVSYDWTSYRDCPFINKDLLREYEAIAYTDGSGRYQMIYRLMVSIASLALKKDYPITVNEIVDLIRQIDLDNSQIYQERALHTEAKRALNYAYRKS